MDKVIENVDYYLAVLPERTQNGEPYGINMMPCNRSEWRVCYYSHYSKNYDDRFGVIVKNTLPEALHAMYQLMLETCPAILKEPPTTPATSWEEVFKSAFEKEREYYMYSIRDILNETTPNHAAFDLLFTLLFERIYYNTSRHWPVSPTPMSETKLIDKLSVALSQAVCFMISSTRPAPKVIEHYENLCTEANTLLDAPSLHQVDRWVRVEDLNIEDLPKHSHKEWRSALVLICDASGWGEGYYNYLNNEWEHGHSAYTAKPTHYKIISLPAAPETDKTT